MPLDQVRRPAATVPTPRHAREEEPTALLEPYPVREPGVQGEVLALLSSLATELDA